MNRAALSVTISNGKPKRAKISRKVFVYTLDKDIEENKIMSGHFECASTITSHIRLHTGPKKSRCRRCHGCSGKAHG